MYFGINKLKSTLKDYFKAFYAQRNDKYSVFKYKGTKTVNLFSHKVKWYFEEADISYDI